jgi:hypothetical protein
MTVPVQLHPIFERPGLPMESGPSSLSLLVHIRGRSEQVQSGVFQLFCLLPDSYE